LGEATYLDHHTERRPDREGNWRDAFVFELEIESPTTTGEPQDPPAPENNKAQRAEPKYWSMSPTSLRDLAERAPSPTTNTTLRRQVVRQRSEAVRVDVLRRADGVCEGCGSPAPFTGKKRRPYLEPHHIYRIADGSPDHPAPTSSPFAPTGTVGFTTVSTGPSTGLAPGYVDTRPFGGQAVLRYPDNAKDTLSIPGEIPLADD
jgi:hypothetical protein